MHSHPHSAPELVPTATSPTDTAASCLVLSAVKARARALKKWRKHERTRLFVSWCASWHALGFSF